MWAQKYLATHISYSAYKTCSMQNIHFNIKKICWKWSSFSFSCCWLIHLIFSTHKLLLLYIYFFLIANMNLTFNFKNLVSLIVSEVSLQTVFPPFSCMPFLFCFFFYIIFEYFIKKLYCERKKILKLQECP